MDFLLATARTFCGGRKVASPISRGAQTPTPLQPPPDVGLWVVEEVQRERAIAVAHKKVLVFSK